MRRANASRRFRSLPLTLIGLAACLLATGTAPTVSADTPIDTRPKNIPDLKLGDNDRQIGDMIQGEVVDHSIDIENSGTGELVITEVRGSCGCTEIVAYPKKLAPGEKGKIEIRLDTKRIVPGSAKKKAVYVTSNDPDMVKTSWFFYPLVHSLFELHPNPKEIRMIGIMDEKKEMTFQAIEQTPKYGLDIISTRSRDGNFSIDKVERLPGEPTKYSISVSSPPVEKAGLIEDVLYFKCRTKDGREIEIGRWCRIEHRDFIIATPALVQFRNEDTNPLLNEGAEPVVKSVRVIAARSDRKFEIQGVRVEGRAKGIFQTRIVPEQAGSRYRIDVLLPAYSERSYVTGKLVIETTDPSRPVIQTDLRARFGRKIRK